MGTVISTAWKGWDNNIGLLLGHCLVYVVCPLIILIIVFIVVFELPKLSLFHYVMFLFNLLILWLIIIYTFKYTCFNITSVRWFYLSESIRLTAQILKPNCIIRILIPLLSNYMTFFLDTTFLSGSILGYYGDKV